jgi:hypothetical protein
VLDNVFNSVKNIDGRLIKIFIGSKVIAEGITITPQIEAGIKSVEDGDGARIMAARSGLVMVLENPMGINGSKHT